GRPRRPLMYASISEEPFGAPGEDEGVAVAVAGDGLDGGGLVDDAGVVKQQQAPWIAQGEALAVGAVGIEDAGLAALDRLALDHQHGHVVHAVAVRALGRGPADAVGGIDAELVRLDMPARRVPRRGPHAGEAAQQVRPGRLPDDFRLDGFEPPPHAAVQGVVFTRLPVRAVRDLLEVVAFDDKARVPPAPVAAAIAQVGVWRQAVPALAQGVELLDGAAPKRGDISRGQYSEASVFHRGRHIAGGNGGWGKDHGHRWAPSAGKPAAETKRPARRRVFSACMAAPDGFEPPNV